MKNKISTLLSEIEKFIPKTALELEAFRLQYLSKKGHISILFDEFKELSSDIKREIGKDLNILKNIAQEKLSFHQNSFKNSQVSSHTILDKTLPCSQDSIGSRHPISVLENEIISIFTKLGFNIAQGPEIEDDWHVFGSLNFSIDHPARDMQDTFFVEKREGQENPILLRTHTSSIQVRAMEKNQPPIRIICPGRVFRNEAISARAHCMFHQIEGLYIDTNVNFADLKSTLLTFAKEMFGSDTKIRLRPSYFPFTEPSAEMDVSCTICGGKGCNVCKYSGWLEVLGCGMVHPNVLQNNGIDSVKYSGFAFGMGIERLVMLKYQIKDLRLFFENDLRFLNQFTTI